MQHALRASSNGMRTTTSGQCALVILGAVLLLVSNGANSVPLFAWLSPIFLLRFVRDQRASIALPAVYLAMTGTDLYPVVAGA